MLRVQQIRMGDRWILRNNYRVLYGQEVPFCNEQAKAVSQY